MPGYDSTRYGGSGDAELDTLRYRRAQKHRKRRLMASLRLIAVFVVALIVVILLGCLLLGGSDAPAGEINSPVSSAVGDKFDDVGVGENKGQPISSEELEPDAAEQLAYIRANANLYPERLVALAEKNPETISFVHQYPELQNQEQPIDLRNEAASGEVPLLMQWDTRWGYESYGDGMMCYTGCGPTCLSMAALYLTGNANVTPLAVARYSEGSRYYFNGTGTAWLLISEGCEGFGMKSEEIALHDTYFYRALDAGKVIICALGPGDFTDEGHFIVIAGHQDKKFIVRDPNSIANSTRLWSFDELKDQIRGIWALSKN